MSVAEKYDVKAGLASVDTFSIMGVSVVTTNKDGRATNDINALWERVFSEQIAHGVPNKMDDVIYAVYSDYEGDHEAPYRLTIGYRTGADGNDTPENMHRVTVHSGEYALLSATGQQPNALIQAWEAIWSSDLERSYKTDFEVYGPRFFEDGVHEVIVHVGVDVEKGSAT